MLWLTALVAAMFGGRAIGIREERKRLGAEVAAEREQLRIKNDELGKQINEWMTSARELTVLAKE